MTQAPSESPTPEPPAAARTRAADLSHAPAQAPEASPGIAGEPELPLHPGAAGLAALDRPLARLGRRARNAFVLALVAPGVVGVGAFVAAGRVVRTGPLLIALVAVLGFLLGMLLVRAAVLRPMARRVRRDVESLATQQGIAMDELLSYAARRPGPDWIPRLVAFQVDTPAAGDEGGSPPAPAGEASGAPTPPARTTEPGPTTPARG